MRCSRRRATGARLRRRPRPARARRRSSGSWSPRRGRAGSCARADRSTRRGRAGAATGRGRSRRTTPRAAPDGMRARRRRPAPCSGAPRASQSPSSTPKSGTKNEPRSSRNDSYEARSITSAPSVATAATAVTSTSLRDAGRGVLQRDARRVDVREGLVGLVDRDRQQRERAREPGRGDGGRQRGGVVEAPAEHEDDAEQEHPGGGHEVPDRDAGEGAAPVAREAGVVRDERDPRDGERDDEVDRDPQREAALARAVPGRAEVGAVDRPPREVDERREHGPDDDALQDLADDADRAGPRERWPRSRRRRASRPTGRGSRAARRRAPRPPSRSRSARRPPSRGTARR